MDNNEVTDNNVKISTWPYMNIGSLSIGFLTRLLSAGVVWGWGYMNWSMGWLIVPIALATWRNESQKDGHLRAITAQASVMIQEKQMITNRIDELPSWVYFPDYDRAEWLNRVLYKIWPGINHFAKDILKETIQPSILERLSEYKIKGFQFDRMVLGRIPPKIYGIKAYDKNTSRNEIILDADIMYAGDCDIKFSLGNIKGGIQNLQIRGLMRIVMKPMLTTIPLVGGIQAFFLNPPQINFNLVGVADVLDFPGLKDILRKIVSEQVACNLVIPNKIVIPLCQDISVESLKIPEPEGVLRIHVVEAKYLMKKDIGLLGKGKSDPYAIIQVGAQEFKTHTIDNTVDPKWNYWCESAVASAIAQQLIILVWDHDDTKGDESLGRATVEVSRVKEKGTLDTWVSLELAKHGMVHLRLTWLQLTKNINDLSAAISETQQLRVTSMSTALLVVYIDSAKNLPCVRGSKQPDAYLEARVDGKSMRTATMLRSSDPVWAQGFTFLVSNPESSVLHLKVIDEKTTLSIGEMQYNVSSLMDKANLEISQQPFHLQMAEAETKLVLSMSLSILKYEEPEPIAEEDNTDHGTIEMNKTIVHQESNVSSKVSSISSDAWKKQSSKESVNSITRNNDSTATVSNEESCLREDKIIGATAPPSINTSPNLVHRNSSITSSAGEAKLGRIQLTSRYNMPAQRLTILVHQIANLPLPANDPRNIPDPYVKLYLLPDRHKDTKRKTIVVKDNCNPKFNETFDYTISQGDMNTHILEISVCTQKAWLSTGSNVIGQVHVKLADIDVQNPMTCWYDIQAELKD